MLVMVSCHSPHPSETDDLTDNGEHLVDGDPNEEITNDDILADPTLELLEDGDEDFDENELADVEMEDHPVFFDPPRDDAIRVFTGHTESTFCVALDPRGRYVASGGQDHLGIVWELESCREVFRTSGHNDSVTCIAFNPEARYLATGDMSGLIQVWSVPDLAPLPTDSDGVAGSPSCINEWRQVWSESVHELQWMLWFPTKGAILLAGAGEDDGSVGMWVVGSRSNAAKFLPGMSGSCVAGELLPDHKRLAVVYELGELRIWDLKTTTVTKSIRLVPTVAGGNQRQTEAEGDGQSTSAEDEERVELVSLACRAEGEMLAVGATGRVFLVHVGHRSCVTTVDTGDGAVVEALGFSSTHPYLAFATIAGTLGVYDVSAMKMRQRWTYQPDYKSTVSNSVAEPGECGAASIETTPVGFCKLVWSPTLPIFFTAGLDGSVTSWDARACNPCPLATFCGHRAQLLDLVIRCSAIIDTNAAPHPVVIATASDDGTVRLFNAEECRVT